MIDVEKILDVLEDFLSSAFEKVEEREIVSPEYIESLKNRFYSRVYSKLLESPAVKGEREIEIEEILVSPLISPGEEDITEERVSLIGDYLVILYFSVSRDKVSLIMKIRKAKYASSSVKTPLKEYFSRSSLLQKYAQEEIEELGEEPMEEVSPEEISPVEGPIPPEEPIFEERRGLEETEEVLKEESPAMLPEFIRQLTPMDQQLFWKLERDRLKALNEGNYPGLVWINKMIENLVSKYVLTEVPVVENKYKQGFKIRASHFDLIQKTSELLPNLESLGVSLESASVLSAKGSLDKGGTVEFVVHLSYPSLSGPITAFSPGPALRRAGIIRVSVNGDNVYLVPFIWDFRGKSYSLDSSGIKDFFNIDVLEKVLKINQNPEENLDIYWMGD